MRIDRDELLVDIGSKSEGIVPSREFSSLNSEEKQALSIGDKLSFQDMQGNELARIE